MTNYLKNISVHIKATQSWSYPESNGNGWTSTCTSGSKQSPINFDTSAIGKATIHANIQYKNYFRTNSRAFKKNIYKLHYKVVSSYFKKYILNILLFCLISQLFLMISQNFSIPFQYLPGILENDGLTGKTSIYF